MRRPTVLLALLLLAILAAMAAKSLLVQIPPVRTQSGPGQFDAVRAKARLASILGDERPHATDTTAGDEVRGRLIAQLAGMGLTPIVRDQIACNELYKVRGVSCGRVRNVIAVIGPRTGKALLLNAHYDSTPVGPAAGDDGVGVATLLEVAALLKDRRLGRPVIFLFNEGEELGLVGARAFLSDPLSRNIDSLINLEARGVRGPANMFETSRPNGPAIGVFSKAADHPVANSLSTDVYRLMPNYTDVNSFSERGWLTLNLAVIGNETRYHSPGDDIAALDPASLQHMGDQTLAMAERLANGTPAVGGERIFMDVAGTTLVTLPLAVGAVLLALLLVAAGWTGWRRRRLVGGSALVIGVVLGSTALAWLLATLLGLARPGMFWRAYPIWTHLAVYASALLVVTALLARFGGRFDRTQLRASYWFLFLTIGALIGLVAPGGIIYFLFPPLLAVGGMLASRYWRPAERVGSALAILALFVTFGAMLALLEELLNQGPMWAFAPIAALIVLPLLIEAMPLLRGAGPRGAAAVAALVALAGWAAAAAAPAYSADRQQRFVIEHVTDAAARKALWSVLNDGAPPPPAYGPAQDWRWTKLPFAERKRWLAEAPSEPGVQAPAIQPLSVVRHGSERTIVLRLRSNGAERMFISAPEDARIRAAGVRGFVRPIDPEAQAGRFSVACSGRSCDGLEMTIVQGKTEPTVFTLVGARTGLPPSAAPLVTARPRSARPQYAPDQMLAFTKVRL